MNIRRPLAASFIALALVGGPVTLTACASPSGGGNSEERNDGTTDDESSNTSGSNPGDVSQGNLPRNDSNEQSSTENEDRNENSDRDK